MPVYAGINGIKKEIKKFPVGIGGITKDQKEIWTGINGVKKKIFALQIPNVLVQLTGTWDGEVGQGKIANVVINGTKYNRPQTLSVKQGTSVTVNATGFSSGGSEIYHNNVLKSSSTYTFKITTRTTIRCDRIQATFGYDASIHIST